MHVTSQDVQRLSGDTAPPGEFELQRMQRGPACPAGTSARCASRNDATGLPDGEEPEPEESVATMDEIAPGLEEGEASEYGELEGDLSLEELRKRKGRTARPRRGRG